MKDNNSLAHSTWNCKYHLVFAPKYRRMELYGKIRKDIATDQISIKEYINPFEKEEKEKNIKKDWDHLSGSLKKKYGWQTVQ